MMALLRPGHLRRDPDQELSRAPGSRVPVQGLPPGRRLARPLHDLQRHLDDVPVPRGGLRDRQPALRQRGVRLDRARQRLRRAEPRHPRGARGHRPAAAHRRDADLPDHRAQQQAPAHLRRAPINVLFKREPIALGAAKPLTSGGLPVTLDEIDELEDDASFGIGRIEDFSWKGMLDFATCTECGRCQSQCPAWNTEKPLSPKLLIMGLRDHAFAKAPYILAGEDGRDGVRRRCSGRGGAPPGRRDRGRGVAPDRRRHHRPRRALVVRDLRRLRAAVPRRHRARRPHRRHAPLPGARRVVVPGRAEPALQGPRDQGQPVEHVGHRPARLDQGPRLRRARRRRRPRVARVGRLAVLGRLRGRLRGPRQEDHPRGRRAAQHRRRLLRRAGQRRDLHGRLGAAGRQRVRLPGPGPAEHRDLQGVQGQEGRLDLRPLLQHAEERVPAVRHRARGRPPHPAAQPARARGPAHAGARRRRRGEALDHLPRPVLHRPSQPGLRAAARAPPGAARRRRSSRWSATPSGPSAAAPAARACGWRRRSARGSTSTAPPRRSAPAPTRSRSAARSAG